MKRLNTCTGTLFNSNVHQGQQIYPLKLYQFNNAVTLKRVWWQNNKINHDASKGDTYFCLNTYLERKLLENK